jgi:Cu-Zn family superoxide dismutase
MFRSGFLAFAALCAVAASGTVALADKAAPTYAAYVIDTTGKSLGTITLLGVGNGVQFRVDVSGLPEGQHGMHVHEFGSCNALRDTAGKATPFGAAGAHFDPMSTNSHKGPDGGGHAGDLPNLIVNYAGIGQMTFFDSNLTLTGPNSIVGKSIVIHANPDNYTDTPPNGGSGGRIACGEIGALRPAM